MGDRGSDIDAESASLSSTTLDGDQFRPSELVFMTRSTLPSSLHGRRPLKPDLLSAIATNLPSAQETLGMR
ncbi:MAG: hypothetical protein DI565_10805 [Ancylobacter novellus]|uniref:Uncharacterized protein n=1 Tax=Ancylobacter novellus TaxID=921 RepID=A0A2W5KHI5_ANCNO|nr:MAG: hypothetical protein DI565_10805 [Ancylobacter novellus]